jgi:hypothetical protein
VGREFLMAYNGSQQIVYRTSDGLILRYGFCDFAAQGDFNIGSESIVENDFRFEHNPKRYKYNWNGSGIDDNGAYVVKSVEQIFEEIENTCTAQQWEAIENWIDNHYMFAYKLSLGGYIKARERIQAAYDGAQIPQEIYNIIMAIIPTEDTP